MRHTIVSWMVLMVTIQALSMTSAQIQQSSPTVVFICEHGAAKSVIAAAYFNKLAAERHLNFRAIARGITPQADLSTSALTGLRKDNVPFPDGKPSAVTRKDLQRAARVIAFCPMPASLSNGRRLSSFDVPEPKAGYEASRDAILVHVKKLINELASERGENTQSH